MKRISILLVLIVFLISACTFVEPAETTETNATTAAQITSLKMYITESQEMTLGGLKYESWVKVDPADFDKNDIEFVSMNPETISIEAGKVAAGGNIWFTVTANKTGISGFYAQTKDESIKSEVVKVTVLN